MGNTSTAAHITRLNATLAELTARRDALVAAFPLRVDVTDSEAGDESIYVSNQVVHDGASSSAETPDKGSAPLEKSLTNGDDLHEADLLGGTSQSTPKTVSGIERTSHQVISLNSQFHTSSAAHTTPTLSLPRSITTHPEPDRAHPQHTTQTPHCTSPTQLQIDATLKLAHAVIQAHIKRLHDYNEVKDVAQMLMGLLADKRGVRIVDVMEELGVDGEMCGD